MSAAKQGNYTLSYTIYSNLFHDPQYDCKVKSEILASRATTLLLEEKCFESIDDCTQAIAYNQWNKLAYVVRGACWMIKQEYAKAVEDYSKLFHFFDQSQHVLDLLNLAYEKFKLSTHQGDDEEEDQSIRIEQDRDEVPAKRRSSTEKNVTRSFEPTPSFPSPTASFIQPAVYLCYPYQAYPTWYNASTDEQKGNGDDLSQSLLIGRHASTSSDHQASGNGPSLAEAKHAASQFNNNAMPSSILDNASSSNLIWVKNSYRLV